MQQMPTALPRLARVSRSSLADGFLDNTFHGYHNWHRRREMEWRTAIGSKLSTVTTTGIAEERRNGGWTHGSQDWHGTAEKKSQQGGVDRESTPQTAMLTHTIVKPSITEVCRQR